jgi:glycosyltransferase involved in cell wall biosynthesis
MVVSAPLVSIVVPCYRQGHFLAGAIESALAQAHPAVEVIVVNDGSDDSTDDVARTYNNRIKYIQQVNLGLPGARNSGIAASTGKFLLFLDADDLLHSDAVRRLVEAAGGREDVLCVMGCRLFEREQEWGEERLPPDRSELSQHILVSNPMPPHAYFSSRSMVVAHGAFDRGLKSHEDWDLWLRLLFAGAEAVRVPLAGAYYRQHPQSMSRNLARMAETRAEVLRRTLERAVANPSRVRQFGADPEELVRRLRGLVASEHFDAGYLARQQGAHTKALYHYFMSFYRGRPSVAAVSAACKVIPHKLLGSLATDATGSAGR